LIRLLFILLLLSFHTCVSIHLYAQFPAFQSNIITPVTQCPGILAFSPVSGMVIQDLDIGSDLNCVGHTSPMGLEASQWPLALTPDYNSDSYFMFSVYGAGCPYTLDSLNIWLRKSASDAPSEVRFRYSLNQGAWQDLSGIIDLNTYPNASVFPLHLNMSLLPDLNSTDQIRIRMYAWGAGSVAGSLRWVSDIGYVSGLYGHFPNLTAGTIAQDQIICPGNNGTLTLSGFNTLILQWQYAHAPYTNWNIIGNTSTSQNFSGLTLDTRYRVLGGCGIHTVLSDPVELSWGPADAVISGDQTLCTGQVPELSVHFNGIFPWDLSWTDGTQTFSQTGISNNPYLIQANALQSATYTLLTLENACGSGGISGQARVGTGQSHSLVLSGDAEYCGSAVQAPLHFNFTGSPPWDIVLSDGSNLTSIQGISQTPFIYPIPLAQSTTYTLISSFSGACVGSVSGSAMIGIHPMPTLMVMGNMDVCKPDTLELRLHFTGTSPWQFFWSDGNQQYHVSGIVSSPYSIDIPNPSPFVFEVNSYSDQYCGGAGGIIHNIQIHDPPSAVIAGQNVLCVGQSRTLLAQFQGTPPFSLTWTDGVSNFQQTGIMSMNALLQVSPMVSTTYTLVSVSDRYCTSTDVGGMAEFIVYELPGITTSGDTSICFGSEVPLYFNFTGTGPWGFEMEANGIPYSFSGLTSNPFILPDVPLTDTHYSILSVINVCGTYPVNHSFRVTVRQIPEITLDIPDWLCEGEDLEIIIQGGEHGPWTLYYMELDRPDSIPGIQELPYTWSISNYDTSGIIYITHIKDAYCLFIIDTQLQIPVYPKPIPFMSYTDTLLWAHFLNLSTMPLDSVVWEFGDGKTSREMHPVYEYEKGGEYILHLEIKDAYCRAELDTQIWIKPLYEDYLVVYGNPTDGNFTFSINYLQAGDRAEIEIISRTGVVLYSESAISGGNRIFREVQWKNKVSTGLYFIRVFNRHGVFYAKVRVEF